MRILLTGATGFIGNRVRRALLDRRLHFRLAVRTIAATGMEPDVEQVQINAIGPRTDWASALSGVSDVIHLAGLAHVLHGASQSHLEDYRAVNAEGTLTFARAAVKAGVRRFVFLSSARVHGERSFTSPFTERHTPSPTDLYSESKWHAEQELANVALFSSTQFVVLRPPLVYGPGVKANFLRLLRSVERGWPIPLGAVRNRRSLLYVDNLADAIITALVHPAAAGKTFLVSDGQDLATPDLLRRVALALGCPSRVPHVPLGVLRMGAKLLGRQADFDRLCGDFVIDSSMIRTDLAWTPPWSVEHGIA